ncbi:MAG: XRE family transcriptional regulator [Verrucomicrobia bacterium]|nr:XRE family transcriptional regulator [Verrucomicrobiota bacterium]
MEEGKMKDKAIISTDNIFADLGLSDSEEMRTRSDLMSEVVNIIRKSGLPQKEIATILEISAPKVSSLMSGKINDFSNDTLMNYLTLLGCNIEIRVVAKHQVSKSVKRGKMKVKRPAARRRKTNSPSKQR